MGRGAPWIGPRSGNALRREAFLRGAAQAGPVDYVMLGGPRASPAETPSFVQSVSKVEVTSPRTGVAGHSAWQARAFINATEPPYELSRFRVADVATARAILSGLFASHDVLWLLDKHAARMVCGMFEALSLPSLLDLDELVAERCAQEIALLRHAEDVTLRARLGTRVQRAFLKRNERAVC